ncbi:MAG: energy transducer TonB [Bacteroidota bacterium]
MEATQFLNSNFLDILFEGKNKTYGAYELRVHYKRRLLYAMISIAVISIGFSSMLFFPFKPTPIHTMYVGPEVHLTDATVKRDKPIEVKPKKQISVATKKITTTIPIIVREKVIEKMNDVPDEIIIPATTIIGEGNNQISDNVLPGKTGAAIDPLPKIAKNIDSLYSSVQVLAQFPGGAAAWQKYLERNLDLDIPIRNGAPAGKYTIHISFIVDKEGNISNVSAINDPGYGLASEAIRVIAKSKQWLPAIQDGRNVKYMQVQPITFVINDN